MKKIISIFLLVGMALSVSAQEHTKLGYSFENTSFHFGDVEQWDNPLATFTFTNKSKNEMLILPSFNENDLKVITPNQAIKPNEKVVITAIYYTASNGSFNRKFPIYFSQLTEPIYLTLSGNIKTLSESAYIQCPMAKPETTKTKIELTSNVAEKRKEEEAFASIASKLPKEKIKVSSFNFEYDSQNNTMTLAPEHLSKAYCQSNRKKPSGVTYQCCEDTKKSKELDKVRGKNNKFYHCQKTSSSGSIWEYYLLVGSSIDNTKIHISIIDAISDGSDSLFHYVYKKGKKQEEAHCGIQLSKHVEYDHGKDEFSRFRLPHTTRCFHIQGDEHQGLCSYALKVAKENSTEKDWQNFQTFLETDFKEENKILYERFYLDILFVRNQLVKNKGMLKPKFLKEEHSQKISKKAINNLFTKYYEGVKENLDKKLITTLEKAKEDSYFERRLIKRCKILIQENQ